MPVPVLPTVNATLNATATVLLSLGYSFIRKRQIERHKRTMIAAFAVSIAFLICYVVYHVRVGSVHYPKTGVLRAIYYSILVTHVSLAATVPILAPITIGRAWKGEFSRHRAIARWTFPIWLYVSISGVIVYAMLAAFR